MAIRVIEETGLLPHLNPGVMSYEEIARLKHVSASMGMMLETASLRLSGAAAAPITDRRTRCRRGCAIEDAGRLAVPFTTASSSASARPIGSAPKRCSRSATCTGATGTWR